MTTIKEILDQFNALFRYGDILENIDIGDYSFDEAHMDSTEYMMEFTSKTNPDVWLRINDDRAAAVLIEKISDEEVKVTSWRMGQVHQRNFPLKEWKPYTGKDRKPFLTKKDE